MDTGKKRKAGKRKRDGQSRMDTDSEGKSTEGNGGENTKIVLHELQQLHEFFGGGGFFLTADKTGSTRIWKGTKRRISDWRFQILETAVSLLQITLQRARVQSNVQRTFWFD
jgi:hypothetical protein